MEWYGRYGMVRYGMVWYGNGGMVWYGTVWHWCDMVWYAMVRHGMVWYGMVRMVWYGMVWYGMVWYGMVCVVGTMVWYGVCGRNNIVLYGRWSGRWVGRRGCSGKTRTPLRMWGISPHRRKMCDPAETVSRKRKAPDVAA